MARRLSPTTVSILRRLWYLPWASAADIAAFGGLRVQIISNVSLCGKRRGWLDSKKLDRTREAVDRFVFTTQGISAATSLYTKKPPMLSP